MQIVLVKYIRLICMTLSFTNQINCDKIFLHDELEDKQIYAKSSCTVRCLEMNLNLTLIDCFERCQFESIERLQKTYENFDLNFLCRDDSSLAFEIVRKEFGVSYKKSNLNETTVYRKNHNTKPEITNRLFIVKVHKAQDPIEQQCLLTNSTLIKIENLLSNTTYNISAATVNSNDEYSTIVYNVQYVTLQKHYKPNEVVNISLINFEEDQKYMKQLKGTITWKPAIDMTCHYDILCYPSDKGIGDIIAFEIKELKDLHSYTIDNFSFGTQYYIGVRSKNTKDSSKESNLKYINITTPSCLEWYQYDLNICPPNKPTDINIMQIPLSELEYSINISWNKPTIDPNYYIITVLDVDLNLKAENESIKSFSQNLTGDQNSFFIPFIEIKGYEFEVYVTAYSRGGNITSYVSIPLRNVFVTDKANILKLIVAVIILLILFTMLSILIFIMLQRKSKAKQCKMVLRIFGELEKKTSPIDPNSNLGFSNKKKLPLEEFQQILEDKLYFDDQMEIIRENLQVHEILGEGAFGIVRRGILLTEDNTYLQVAVKMIKDHPNIEDIKGFRREIDVMKSVGTHQNIVSIVGHFTRDVNEMMLLTEYCNKGNLLNFLRHEWKHLNRTRNKKKLTRTSSLTKINIVTSNNNNKIEDELKFDSSFLDKISLKYKSNSSQIENNNLSQASSSIDENDSKSLLLSIDNKLSHEAKLLINDSYDLNEKSITQISCTNFCKCQVNVINLNHKNIDKKIVDKNNKLIIANENIYSQMRIRSSHEDSSSNKSNKIEIENCNCNENKKFNCEEKQEFPVNHQHTIDFPLFANNQGYYKLIDKLLNDFNNDNECNENSNNNKDNDNSVENNFFDLNKTSSKTKTNSIINLSEEDNRLTNYDLLNIAKQIALGMEYLAKCKVVHRDLAARNVLVCNQKIVKIADFGLSRDVYHENIYKKTGNGKLPIKWLALESMTHQIYTTQSDVWSYGILLFEIVTLGCMPYPAIQNEQLTELLKSGYRMKKPRNCSSKLYNLMMKCWNEVPSERPMFSEIVRIIDNLIDSSEIHIKNLSIDKKTKKSDQLQDELYLNPVV